VARAGGLRRARPPRAGDLGKVPAGGVGRRLLEGTRGRKGLAALDAVSQPLGATAAQVALAWVMARPAVAAPIASATSLEQLEELTGAARLALDPAHIARLDSASA